LNVFKPADGQDHRPVFEHVQVETEHVQKQLGATGADRNHPALGPSSHRSLRSLCVLPDQQRILRRQSDHPEGFCPTGLGVRAPAMRAPRLPLIARPFVILDDLPAGAVAADDHSRTLDEIYD